jgi:hypothetical protein
MENRFSSVSKTLISCSSIRDLPDINTIGSKDVWEYQTQESIGSQFLQAQQTGPEQTTSWGNFS